MAAERSQSMPPGDIVNPWWSERLQAEALLRRQRPEDLPIPQDDDLNMEAVQDYGAAGCSGKGRGSATMGGPGLCNPTGPPRFRGKRAGWRKADGGPDAGGVKCGSS